jgi:hypothetical protein
MHTEALLTTRDVVRIVQEETGDLVSSDCVRRWERLGHRRRTEVREAIETALRTFLQTWLTRWPLTVFLTAGIGFAATQRAQQIRSAALAALRDLPTGEPSVA